MRWWQPVMATLGVRGIPAPRHWRLVRCATLVRPGWRFSAHGRRGDAAHPVHGAGRNVHGLTGNHRNSLSVDPDFLPRVMHRNLTRPPFIAFAALVSFPGVAAAHTGRSLQPHDLWGAWTFEPAVVIAVLITGAVYTTGVLRLWAR